MCLTLPISAQIVDQVSVPMALVVVGWLLGHVWPNSIALSNKRHRHEAIFHIFSLKIGQCLFKSCMLQSHLPNSKQRTTKILIYLIHLKVSTKLLLTAIPQYLYRQ